MVRSWPHRINIKTRTPKLVGDPNVKGERRHPRFPSKSVML